MLRCKNGLPLRTRAAVARAGRAAGVPAAHHAIPLGARAASTAAPLQQQSAAAAGAAAAAPQMPPMPAPAADAAVSVEALAERHLRVAAATWPLKQQHLARLAEEHANVLALAQTAPQPSSIAAGARRGAANAAAADGGYWRAMARMLLLRRSVSPADMANPGACAAAPCTACCSSPAGPLAAACSCRRPAPCRAVPCRVWQPAASGPSCARSHC